MTTFEIFSVIILIIGFWINAKIDIAKVQAQYTSLQAELKEHKENDNFRYEQMRKDNREDHQKLFDKIEQLRTQKQ